MQAAQAQMMLLQVNETDWAVVMLDQASGKVRELQVDAETAQKVQAGELSPNQLAAMLAQQQAAAAAEAGGSSGEGAKG